MIFRIQELIFPSFLLKITDHIATVMFKNHQSANVAHNNYYVQESIGRWKPVVLKNGNKIKLSDSGKFKQVNLYPKIPGWKYHLLPRDK